MRDTTRDQVLSAGIARLRQEHEVPDGFCDALNNAAQQAASDFRPGDRPDRTDIPFATLDPASSTDLDQAFAVSTEGDDVVLHYAIADVEAFVAPGSALDLEAWNRALTVYLPDGKAGVYPPALAEAAASLLPDGPRPAVVMTVAVDPQGKATLRSAERAMIRSRAKLAYDAVGPGDLPPELAELARRIRRDEDARGASRVEFPEQEIVDTPDGGYELRIRPRLASEDDNATMSLAANLAVAGAMQSAGVGLFRVMEEPDAREVKGLRHAAHCLGLRWAREMPLDRFARSLSTDDPKAAAFLLSVRRASGGASYAPFTAGVAPWHAAIASTYAHATAPLRRLADKYVLATVVALSAGRSVPEAVLEAFERLPEVMDAAEARTSKIDREVVDLVEAVSMMGRIGQQFTGAVIDIDQRGGVKVQIDDPAIIARVEVRDKKPGDVLSLRLDRADPEQRQVSFSVI